MNTNVVLREVLPSDLPIFYEQQLDPEAVRMADFPSRDRETFMTHWGKIMSDHTNLQRTVVFDGAVAGYIVSWNQSGQREVGYWLGREYWGRGIATLALSILLRELNMRPLYAHVVRHNIASRRVLQKCGFTVSGADRTLSGAGEPVEELIFRLD
jgi:RimJ/RimL family protein N-acetyltransferase